MIGNRVGRYEIIGEISRGGMSTVYEAYDSALERHVAIKTIIPYMQDQEVFRSRFFREAQTVSRFENPAILPVYDFVERGNDLYLILPLLTGGSLRDKLEAGPLPLTEVLAIVDRIALALKGMHEAGVVHRTLRPSEILFDEAGDAFLTDFGLVTWIDEVDELEDPDSIIGVPSYMSPEQVEENEVDGRADIYAFGLIIFEMLTNEQLFQEDNPAKTMMAHLFGPELPLSLPQGTPAGVQQVLQQAIAKDPEERYQDALVMAADLRQAIESPETFQLSAPSTVESLPQVRQPSVSEISATDIPLKIASRYEIQGVLTKDAISIHYLAHDKTLNRHVRVIVLDEYKSTDPEFVDRFIRSGKMLAGLVHPAILPIYHAGYENEFCFQVVPEMAGGCLADKISGENNLDLPNILTIVEQISAGLDHIHKSEIIHRDVKPHNILLDKYGNSYLLNFIIGRDAKHLQYTMTGALQGTPAYMSPEMIYARPVDARSDIYSLGIMLFEMLTGKRPYTGDTAMSMLMAHINEPIPDILMLRPDLPDSMQLVLERALAKDPDDRYQDVLSFAADVKQVFTAPEQFSLQHLPKDTLHQISDVEPKSVDPPPDLIKTGSESDSMEDLVAGDQIGRYQIQDIVGRGGKATVYLAFDPMFKRQVSVKVLRRALEGDVAQNAFEKEAQVLASIEHSAIVPVYDYGEYKDMPYLVMRYMAFGSLSHRLKKELLSTEEILAIMDRIAAALDVVHRLGIVHLDIKPGNIVFDTFREAFLSDFGICQLIRDEVDEKEGELARMRDVLISLQSLNRHTFATATALTAMGALAGTPAYMSPEQIEGRPLDGRTDVYSLGITLFQMLARRLPFNADSPVLFLANHLNEPVPDIRRWRPDLPDNVQYVLEKALAKTPENRYQSVGEFAVHLREAMTTPQLFMG